MELSELKKEKVELEKQITTLINNFTKKYNVNVLQVDYVFTPGIAGRNINIPTFRGWKVKVQI